MAVLYSLCMSGMYTSIEIQTEALVILHIYKLGFIVFKLCPTYKTLYLYGQIKEILKLYH